MKRISFIRNARFITIELIWNFVKRRNKIKLKTSGEREGRKFEITNRTVITFGKRFSGSFKKSNDANRHNIPILHDGQSEKV